MFLFNFIALSMFAFVILSSILITIDNCGRKGW